MRHLIYFFIILFIWSCKENPSSKEPSDKLVEPSTDSISIGVTTFKEAEVKDFREFKVLDSKYINTSELWSPFESQLKDFSENDYETLKPLILEQDIPALQKHIADGKLNYEKLTKFYLYRIRKLDRENDLSLNSVISINPNVIEQAKQA